MRLHIQNLSWVDEFGDKKAFIAIIGDSKNTRLYIVKNSGYKAKGYQLRVSRGKTSFKVLGKYSTLMQAKQAAESWILAGMPMNVAQEYMMGPIKHSYKSF
jgi:hypothetical protein